ncbi:MAG: iron-containing alcohol dehydrogenase [Armatimonadetes bacterium]|nr:iron-containing alcohol dehydrogenase [Armatimonadota bacterium]
MSGTFAFPTRIEFGAGVVEKLPGLLAGIGVKHPLVVTDAGLVKVGLLGSITGPLDRAGMKWTLFDGVEPNPTEKSVFPGVDAYRAAGCDGIVAVGGGSAIDAAKAIRLKIHHPQPLEIFDDTQDGGRFVTANLPPMVAIATTSGTGSEVSRSTVIHLESNNRKTVIFSPYLIPTIAVADPALTAGLPPALTAYTGADALTHNVEAYLSKGFHPIADPLALRGVQLVGRYLRRAVRQGDDLEARAQMMIASMLGAIAFQKGLGATHSLAHPLSSICGLHHGLSNAIMLPHVLEFNKPHRTRRLADLAEALEASTLDAPTEEVARAGILALSTLLHDVGIPTRLSDVGVREEHVPKLVAQAVEDGCHQLNPRPCTAEDFERLYRAAL